MSKGKIFKRFFIISFLCGTLFACASTNKTQMLNAFLYDVLSQSDFKNDQGKHNPERYPRPKVESFEDYQKQRNELLKSSQK